MSRLPFDTLGIDLSFTLGMDASESGRTLVKTIIGLVECVRFTVIAEGVERAPPKTTSGAPVLRRDSG
jgi:EAL domain-containing protein (putative c-di-GMP-specific phosphodiesterase class I)